VLGAAGRASRLARASVLARRRVGASAMTKSAGISTLRRWPRRCTCRRREELSMAELIVVGFKKDMYRASEALNMLQDMNSTWMVDLSDAVAVYRDYKGKLRVDQSYQMTTAAETSTVNHLKTAKQDIDRKPQDLKSTHDPHVARAKSEIEADVG
jgi:hypothetical protein